MSRASTVQRTALAATATVVLLAAVSACAIAQTLTEPNPPPKAPPSTVTKSHPAAHVKDCSAYGPGFRAMPGSDLCIKVGGSVTVEVGH